MPDAMPAAMPRMTFSTQPLLPLARLHLNFPPVPAKVRSAQPFLARIKIVQTLQLLSRTYPAPQTAVWLEASRDVPRGASQVATICGCARDTVATQTLLAPACRSTCAQALAVAPVV